MSEGVVIPKQRTRGPAAPATPEPAAESRPGRGLAPCLLYLTIEFARPMAWVPALASFRPGMIAALWGVLAVLMQSKRRPIPKVMWYMFGFIVLMTWHIPFAFNNRWALWGLQDFAIVVVGSVLPLAVLPRNLAALRYLLTAYVFLHAPMAVYALMNGGRGQGGWVADENDLALVLNVGLGVAVFLLMETTSTMKRLLLIGTMGLMLTAVVSTMSRGGFVGLAALALYVVLLSPRRMTMLLLIAVAVAGLFLFAPPTYWNEVRSIKSSNQEGDTGEQRMYLWGMGWRMFLDHPITGVGTRNYGVQAPFYENEYRANSTGYHTWGRVAHSMYVTLLSEQGLVGVVLFVLLLAFCFKTQRRLRRESNADPDDPDRKSGMLMATGLLAGLFALLVTGTFITVIYYPLLWVLAGFFGSLDAVTPSKPEPAEAPPPARKRSEQPREA
jgi:probable O-glycosylation ligase (exosortase A-associated)